MTKIIQLLAFPTFAQNKPYDPSKDAYKDYQSALNEAKEENKNIFIVVGGNWCMHCLKFDAKFRNSKTYKIIEESFIYLKVNYSDENKNEEFFGLFPKIVGYPHVLVISPKGAVLEQNFVPHYKSDKEFNNMIKRHVI